MMQGVVTLFKMSNPRHRTAAEAVRKIRLQVKCRAIDESDLNFQSNDLVCILYVIIMWGLFHVLHYITHFRQSGFQRLYAVNLVGWF